VALNPLPSEVAETCFPTSKHWKGFPSKVRIATGRLCSAGSGLLRRSPTSLLVCSPPTPLRHRPRLRSSLAVGLPRDERFSEPAAPAFVDVRRAGDLGLGPPLPQLCSWTVRGFPGYWIILVPRATATHSAGSSDPSPAYGVVACCLRGYSALGQTGMKIVSELTHVAHRLAHLRIHRRVTETVARLATGLPGWALAGRDSHPLDDRRDFVIVHSLPTSIAWSHE
jgi:hypothetical protein